MDPTSPANSTMFNLTHPANQLLAIIRGTLGALGMPGNLFLMIFIAYEYRKRKPYEWLLFQMALGDFLYCLNNATLESQYITKFDRVQCKVAGAHDYVLGTMSFLVPPLVAYNRYLSLYNNQRCGRLFTNRSVFVIWMVMLALSICWVSPFILMGGLGQDDLGLCGLQVRNTFLAWMMMLDCGVIGLAYIILLWFSYKVIRRIRQHKKQANAQSQLQTRFMNESHEIIKAMLIISAIPMFAQMPAVIVKVIQICRDPLDPWISRLAMAWFPATPLANAYVTVYVIKEYRKNVGKMIKKVEYMIKKTNAVAPEPVGTSTGAGRRLSGTRAMEMGQTVRHC